MPKAAWVLLALALPGFMLGAVSPATAYEVHNSDRFGTCTNTAYDGTSQADCEGPGGGVWTPTTKHGGDWGVSPTSKYGQITCETCHTRDTTNIKRVSTSITAPNSPTDDFPGSAVQFLNPTDGSSDFGDDSRSPKNSSDMICEVCHTYDATQTAGVKQHAYDMQAPGDPGHYNNSDCISCHTHGKGFAPEGCDACHGNPPTVNTAGGPNGLANNPGATGSTTEGKHQTHAVTLGFVCDTCHTGSTMPESGLQVIDIGFENFAAGGGTYGGQAGTDGYRGKNGTTISGANDLSCSNIYCHSDATTALGTSSNNWPVWNGALRCGDCHDDNTNAADAQHTGVLMSSGSHSPHLSSGFACSACHNGAGSGTAEHVDHEIDVVVDPTKGSSPSYSGTLLPGDATGNCSATYCHSGNAALWGAWNSDNWGTDNSSFNECTRCHGTKTVGAATETQKAPAIGMHASHLDATHNISAPVACSHCHAVPAAVTDAGHIDDGSANAEVVTRRPNTLAVAGTYDDVAATCATTYCHASRNGGTDQTPAFDTSLLTRVMGTNNPTVAECEICHGIKPQTPDHSAVADNDLTACTTCHDNWTGTIFTDPSLHVNGIVEGGCTSCHDYPADTGAHLKHTAVAAGLVCADCHLNPGAAPNHKNGNVDVEVLATYTFDGGAIVYTQGSTKTCSNVGCHYQESPGWQVCSGPPAVDPIACDKCHGGSGNSYPPVTIRGTDAEGAHVTHMTATAGLMNGDAGAGVECDDCHVVPASMYDAGHTDTPYPAEVVFGGSTIADIDGGSPPVFTPEVNPDNGIAGQCSNVYCHGASMPNGDTAGANRNPRWNDANASGCGLCHGNPPTSHSVAQTDCKSCHTDVNATNNGFTTAVNHINGTVEYDLAGAACDICHGDGAGLNYPPVAIYGADGVGAHVTHMTGTATIMDGGVACADCHTVPATADAAGHIDGSYPADVSMAGSTVANYNGASPAFVGDGTPANGTGGQCNSVYCHGAAMPNGDTTGANTAPLWSDTNASGCGFCHGAPPASHSAFSGGGTDCSSCHTHVVASDDGFLPSGTPGIELHMNGVVNYDAAALTCSGCHGSYPPATGAHAKHAAELRAHEGLTEAPNGPLSGWTTDHGLCAACHDMSNTANHTDATDYITVPGRGFDSGSPSYNSGTGSCSNVNCHFQPTTDWKCP